MPPPPLHHDHHISSRRFLSKSSGNHLRGPTSSSVASDPTALIIACVLLIVCCTLVLALCGCRPAPRAYLTQEELDDARLRKEGERESAISVQMAKLERRLRGSRMRKAALEGGQEEERLLEEKKEEWNVKGKAVYGDAWDTEVDGGAPVKDLFGIPDEELRGIKIEAYNAAAKSKLHVEEAERTARATARAEDFAAPSTAGENAAGLTPGPELALMGGGRRRHAPVVDAPFHDPRFVSRPSANRRAREGEGRFASNPAAEAPPAPPAPTTTSMAAAQSELLDFRSRGAAPQAPPAGGVHLQAKGLSHPLPPPAPFAQARPPPLPRLPPPAKKSRPRREEGGGLDGSEKGGGGERGSGGGGKGGGGKGGGGEEGVGGGAPSGRNRGGVSEEEVEIVLKKKPVKPVTPRDPNSLGAIFLDMNNGRN